MSFDSNVERREPESAGDALQVSPSDALFGHVANPVFPCVGSKAALAKGAIRTIELARLGHPFNAARLHRRLAMFARDVDARNAADSTVHSMAALFPGSSAMDESAFEAALWTQLRELHAIDVAGDVPWNPSVSADPASPQFSMSIAGHAFFVIGLHPGASRIARRFEMPALVFNSHVQFDRLKADGRYAKMQTATRERDVALQGSINPNLADHGQASEARQYSGRAVGDAWRCPFSGAGA